MSRLRLVVSLSLFVIFAGCAVAESSSAFKTVPTGKTASSASRFHVLDDFNAGLSETKLGTVWKTSETNDVKIGLYSEREDALKHGGSLRIEYTIPPHESVRFFTPLNELDSSQAEAVVFLLRKKELDSFRGKIAVELRDYTGKTVPVNLHPSMRHSWEGPQGEWVEITIPRADFKPLDFNRLDRFQIVLSSSADAEISGSLILDEVAFFGPAELVFRSDEDNLVGFPKIVIHESRRAELLEIQDDQQFLLEVARDTWLYFENLIDQSTHLPVDHVRVGEVPGVGSYVSPTNLALYWIGSVAAYDLSLISKEQAAGNIRSSLESFEKLNRWGRGFWYNYYHTRSFRVTRAYVSVVDNGWLAAALVVIRQAFPEEFGERASEFLKLLDFSEFYDPSNGQLKLGYDADKESFSPYHYGLLTTEARLASYIAVGKKDLKAEHWARIYRTLPVEWDWQRQVPQGDERTLFGVPVFEGFYTYLNQKFVPSWGGSLFEFLAPTLLLKEQELAPKGLGKNNIAATDLHIEHALSKKRYPVWGLAPCAVRNGRYWIYREYGIPDLGAKGYADRAVITPYASFLALATRPREAIQNLREMLSRYPNIYGEYGFYDSVDVIRKTVNPQYLVLDQGMSFLAIANYLRDGVVRKRFHSDPIGREGEVLLKEEVFSI